MSVPFQWPEPAWLAAMPAGDERDALKLQFYTRLAGLYCDPKMSLEALSVKIGVHQTTLSKIHRAMSPRMTSHVALCIEKVLGAELFPWRLFVGE